MRVCSEKVLGPGPVNRSVGHTPDRSHMLRVALILASVTHATAVAGDPAGLVYSGRTSWDSAAGILTFESSGTMPESTRRLSLGRARQMSGRSSSANGVTVRGAFRVSYRNPTNPLPLSARTVTLQCFTGRTRSSGRRRTRSPKRQMEIRSRERVGDCGGSRHRPDLAKSTRLQHLWLCEQGGPACQPMQPARHPQRATTTTATDSSGRQAPRSLTR